MDNGIQTVPTIILYKIVTRLGYTEEVNVKIFGGSSGLVCSVSKTHRRLKYI